MADTDRDYQQEKYNNEKCKNRGAYRVMSINGELSKFEIDDNNDFDDKENDNERNI